MKQLRKSSTNKVFCGVCGGIGEYLDLDPTIRRIFWGLMIIVGGGGLIAYLFCAIVMPE